MDELSGESPAKINLTLRVVGRRPDGFHEIESLVARVSLSDTIRLTPRSDLRCTVDCGDPTIPRDERNLALQAAVQLQAAAGIRRGVDIRIEKRIPAGAGLGGASSNAATVLNLLNAHWGLGLTARGLARLGTRIGSDVPLFFHRPVCILRGRGEQIEEVDQPFTAWAALFLPELHSSTRAVYEAWDRAASHPAHPPMREILARLGSPTELATVLFNDLERPACTVQPELHALAERLRRICPIPVQMTGSGSAFFCLCDSPDRAGAVAELVRAAVPGPLQSLCVTVGL